MLENLWDNSGDFQKSHRLVLQIAEEFIVITSTIIILALSLFIFFASLMHHLNGSSEVRKPQQLPEGYEERVKNRGLVVMKEWAPQLEILAHPSVGGFMSHCGWNSCMESISMGVPIAAWPMHSHQPRNACLVTDVLRTGTLVRDWTHRDELVSSTAIDNAARRLMASEEGQELQKRATELGDAVRAPVAKGGVSRSEMDSSISHITR